MSHDQTKLTRAQEAEAALEPANLQNGPDGRHGALRRRLEQVLDEIADGIVVQDGAGRVVYCNVAAARQCGLVRADELLHTDLGAALRRIELRDEAGAPVPAGDLPGADGKILRLCDPSTGRQWFARLQTTSFQASHGEPALTVSVWHDITTERQARERFELLARAGEAFAESRSYEETMRSVVDVALPALGDFAFVDVIEGDRVRRLAAAYRDAEVDETIRATQWVRSERTDINLCALSSGRSALHTGIDDAWMVKVAANPQHLALWRRLQVVSMITVPLRVRGEVLGSLTSCFAKSGRQHTGEDLKLAEELARRAGVALEQVRLFEAARRAARRAEEAAERSAEANRVKDEFLATVSHELRTPLNAIAGWSSLLLKLNSDPMVSKGMEAIHRNAQMQEKIIGDILDVSRIITDKLRLDRTATNLEAIVADAVEVIRPAADAKGLTIRFAPPAAPATLAADPERLQQVIWNLLSNAVKFTEAGGCIDVSVERRDAALTVAVRDTGCGIDAQFLPFVFDPFKQADSSTTRRVGGLGLGLSIARNIVELHGGRVHAASAGLGCGATFTVVLPIEPAAPPGGKNDRPAPPRNAGKPDRSGTALAGIRILIVDDEPDARELIESLMQACGAAVKTAESAAQAFDALERFQPHVLISDIGMPGEDGYSLIRRIRARKDAAAAIPAIALTAYAREEDRARALSAGFTIHIGKPVSADELLAAVTLVARTGTRYSIS